GAAAAVGLLGPEDQASLVQFDDRVDLLQPLTPAGRAGALQAAIAGIEPRGNTDLHGGWAAGADSLGDGEPGRGARRVVLLTDGLANHGVTDPGTIAAKVAEAARRGIATSALGIGEDFNEELLEAVARAGDGSYTFVESPDQLPAFFEAELAGFANLAGREVRLGLAPGPGIQIVSVLNDLPSSNTGSLVLPNLVAGGRQEIGLTVRALPGLTARPGEETELLAVRLEWTDPETGERREMRQAARVRAVEDRDFEALPADPAAVETLALLRTARAKREALNAVDRGDEAGIALAMDHIRAILAGTPPTERTEREKISLASLEEDFRLRKMGKFRKNVHYESYARGHAMDEARLFGHYSRKLLFLVRDRLDLHIGSLAGFPCDAIVNSRSDEPASGLDEALRAAGGPAFRAACEAIGRLGAGAAAVTGGGDLPVKSVIHVRVPDWRGGNASEFGALSECYAACLLVAKERGFGHVAFPVLGAGGRGFPVDAAVSLGLSAAAQFLFSNPAPRRVTFVCPDGPAAELIWGQLP
ncbi:MAG TPA: macro domain-containing protein, partial [Spirochaetia bacterium]|nr:macro domain-containing protein [Spirochaetia bacterium]